MEISEKYLERWRRRKVTLVGEGRRKEKGRSVAGGR